MFNTDSSNDPINNLKRMSEKEIIDAKIRLGSVQALNKIAKGEDKLVAKLVEQLIQEQITRQERDLIILDATFAIMEMTGDEIINLKRALQGLGATVDDVKSLQEKREKVFERIEKITEEIAKSDEEEREKWR